MLHLLVAVLLWLHGGAQLAIYRLLVAASADVWWLARMFLITYLYLQLDRCWFVASFAHYHFLEVAVMDAYAPFEA